MGAKQKPAPAGKAMRTGILVLGMHRSGTSAVTGVLDLLGVELGERLVQAQAGVNDQGFWEHIDVLELDQRLLGWYRRDWHDVRGLPHGALADAVGRSAVDDARRILRRDFAGAGLWAIKDPRLCLTMPVWLDAMAAESMDARFLLAVRDPEEVVASLARRDSITRGHGLLLWGLYTLNAVRGSAAGPRVVVDYARLMQDWRREQERVAKALDVTWPDAAGATGEQVDRFLDPALHRQRASIAPDADPLSAAVSDVYKDLQSLAIDQGDWQALERSLARFESVAAGLVPHLQDALDHLYLHSARAHSAEQMVLAGLNNKTDLLRELHAAATAPRDTSREAGLEAALSSVQAHAAALEARRLELEVEATGLRGEVETYKAELGGRQNQLSALASVLAEKEQRLRDGQANAVALEAGAAALRGEIETLRAEQVRTQGELSGMEGEVARMEGEVARAEAELAEATAALVVAEQNAQRQESLLRDVGAMLDMRSAELMQVVGSKSWRITAPMRWLRERVAAFRAGRRPASYRQMLAVPAASRPAQPPAPTVAQAALARDAYLEVLFATERGAQSSDHVAASTAPAPAPGSLRAKAIAFYLPQFHPFPENDAWWGKGFTEWTNVTRAVPQFLGHYQPRLPADLGFYDLRVPQVLHEQVRLARQYGIHGFCFHYYWFGGRRLLERPLDLFLAQADIDFPFCLCWANENWTRRWDGQDQEVLMSQEHSADNDIAFIADLERYLRDPRYIRVDGKPLVVVYRPSILPDCKATLARWREYCRRSGLGELFLAMVQFDAEDPREFGFDAAMEFPPHKLARGLQPINDSLQVANPDYAGHVLHYQSIVDTAKDWPQPEYPMVRAVFPGWDNEARRPGAGYTFAHATPQRYAQWLDAAIDYAERHPVGGERIVMINAWNEWAEGAYLEPDQRYGHAFLQATREILERAPGDAGDAARQRIVVVSHDAHPHGAQYLALHMASELNLAFGFGVDVVLLEGGRLRDEFAAHATVHEVAGMAPGDISRLLERLYRNGAHAALVNTTVAGAVAGALKRAGFRVVAAVHELPGLIAGHGLEGQAREIARHADHVAFAAPEVRDAFVALSGLAPARAVLRPQGLFTRSRHLGLEDLAGPRTALRRRFGLPADSRIVLAVGYGDHRKGLDLFGEVAALLAPRDPGLHFIWVGHYDQALFDEVRARLRNAGVLDRLHAPGLDFDSDDYYAGADVYALTSREDPFPSVVLEALAVGLPVVAFAGAGGAGQVVSRGCGRLVSPLRADAFADELASLLADDSARAECAAKGRELVARDFSFRRYLFDLLALADAAPPRVSVIVPNYNYAHLLRARLESIAAQTLPPYEVIVLDDASSDDSLAMLARLRGELPLDFRVVPASANSGSVFRQWLKGVELAQGDYVWIAEADDLSDSRFLSTLLPMLHGEPSVAMAYSQSRAIDGDGREVMADYRPYTDDLDPERWSRPYVASGAEEVSAGLAVKNTIPNVSAVVFRRDALLGVLRDNIDRIADCKVAGDWFAYLLLLEDGRIAYTPEVLNTHRRHAASVTRASDQALHLAEVVAAQEMAGSRYTIDAACTATARRYADSLRAQFGLGAA